ncbi:BOLA class I histocompatibility antigen, alpha chain BL3-7-like [Clarias gariepinus]
MEHRVVVELLFLSLFVHLSTQDTHSLQYLHTSFSSRTDGPEFTAAIWVDGEEVVYYDSNISKAIPKTEWIKKNDAEDPDYWNRNTQTVHIIMKRFRPKVSVFQKHSSPSPEVVCNATGFFPKPLNITWQKDGEDVHEDVELRETLPNQDGSFQKRSILKVPAEELQKHTYTCVVQHSSLKKELAREVPKGPNKLEL